jgi:hypothetical protein
MRPLEHTRLTGFLARFARISALGHSGTLALFFSSLVELW